MEIRTLLQGLLPPLLALVAAFAVDRMSERRGLLPAGFRIRPGDSPRQRNLAAASRVTALMVLSLVFWIGVFGPLAEWGRQETLDLSQVPTWQLFLLHIILAPPGGASGLAPAGTVDAESGPGDRYRTGRGGGGLDDGDRRGTGPERPDPVVGR